MKDNMTTFKIWAPEESVWSQWAKPVCFASVPPSFLMANDRDREPSVPKIGWANYANRNTAVIVDMPGKTGVELALGLSALGYRPVPLYNGVFGPNRSSMLVDVTEIVEALFAGADALASSSVRSDAPPVFILDSERMTGHGKQPGKYDNRWCVFPQDMPSSSFLLEQGIKQIIVRSARVQNDLAHILRRYQESGIKIVLCSDGKALAPLTVVKPSKFRSLMYRFQTVSGLTRNAAGGFGGQIPEPTQSSGSGVRFYGYG